MNSFGQAKAAFIAVVVSCLSLLTTVGIAVAVRPNQFSSESSITTPAMAARQVNEDQRGEGRRVYLKHCAECHGVDARGDEGPDLCELRVGDQLIRQVIVAGIKGEMPAYGKKLRESDIRALIVYLRTLRSSSNNL